MEIVLLLARVSLALVFGIAGVAKAADHAGSRRAIIGFGVPEKLASPLARLLPFAEILIALALIPTTTAWFGAISALALLLIFSAGIGVSLARGRAPDCRCFGQLRSEPVGWSTFARNLLLAAMAALVVIAGRSDPGLSALSWLRDWRTAEAVNLVFTLCVVGLVTYLIVFLSGMMQQQAKLFGEIEAIKAALMEDGEIAPVPRKEAALPQEGLPIGAMAPKFSLAAAGGDEMSLDDLLRQGKSVLLLFTTPNCWGCKLLLPAARIWQNAYADLVTVAVLSTGTIEENEDKVIRYEISNLLLDTDALVANRYLAAWTPAAVLIHPDGKIASHVVYSDGAIREWVRNLIAAGQAGPNNGSGRNANIPQISIRYSARKIGEPAPRFSLPDLSGRIVSTEDLLGSPTLLLFWHPRCQFCGGMIEDLKRWEADPPRGAPKLVFIASGEVEEIQALNRAFRSPTLLDPPLDVGPLFGTKFTPSAIVIDGEGRISSSLAMDEHNVRALIGLPRAVVGGSLLTDRADLANQK